MTARRKLIQIMMIGIITVLLILIIKSFIDKMDGAYEETNYAPSTTNTEQVDIIGKKVIDLYHEPEGNYYVIEFEDGTKTAVRFVIKSF